MDRKKKNILNELKNYGPGFKVPESYFSKLEVRLNDNSYPGDAIKENISKQSPQHETLTLEQIGKEAGFSVPEAYFDDFNMSVPDMKETKVIPLKKQFKRIIALSIAASILLFFGINYLNTNQTDQNELVFEDEEFVSWIESDLIEFNSYEIAEVFDDLDLDPDMYGEGSIDEYLNTVDIENLILENN